MTKLVCSVVTLTVLVLTRTAPAGEKKSEVPDEKAMMEAMMKAATPGEAHKKLDPLAGSWEYTARMWMNPAKPPTEFKGTAEVKWVFGNRYLDEDVKGQFGPMEFAGRGWVGYDNRTKKYVSAWIDNFGTGITTSTGTADADGKTITFSGEEIDPVSGKAFTMKNVLRLLSPDKYESAFYKTVGDKEVKQMELTYTRKK